jgi:hypothetical protein
VEWTAAAQSCSYLAADGRLEGLRGVRCPGQAAGTPSVSQASWAAPSAENLGYLGHLDPVTDQVGLGLHQQFGHGGAAVDFNV